MRLTRIQSRLGTPTFVVAGSATIAALLIVTLSNAFGEGLFVFPVLAGVTTYAVLRRVGVSVVAVAASVAFVLPMLAFVVLGAYAIDSLVG